MQQTLDDLAARQLLRRPVTLDSGVGPVVEIDGRRVVCLCSNDYLALAGDDRLRRAAAAAVEQWGVGAGASRLVSGSLPPHRQLERRLAAFKGLPDAVVTSTGWMANQTAIHALAGPGDLILCDKLNHASIVDAAQSSGARLRTFHHGDVERLGVLLARHRREHRHCLIVTDSLFSMDGDLAPLPEIVELKRRWDAVLLIDEAHATGVLGERGRGAAELLGVEDGVDVVVGTLSKALGSMGGFVAGPCVLAELIRSTSRPYIYTTAPAPALCAAAEAALDVVEQEPARRHRVLGLAERLRARLGEMGLPPGPSQSQIVPVVIGEAAAALAVSRRLLEEGFLVPAIRPPTVPRGSSRLRVSLSAGHGESDVDAFCEALQRALAACAVADNDV